MAKQKNTFEQNMKLLEEIVSKLENGDSPLDECITMYEKGISLSKECMKMLDNAEQKVKIISDGNTDDIIGE